MKTLKRLIWFFIYLVPGFCFSQGSERTITYPEVGKPIPDFVLHNIAYFPQKQAKSRDFRGKWLVLDFWTKYCAACVSSFPRTNRMAQDFDGKVQFMLVGIQDNEGKIGPMYAKFREKEKLVMPCAFDSSLVQPFDIAACPFIILVDPDGIVRCIANSIHSEDLYGFLNGNPPILPAADWSHSQNDKRIEYDDSKAFLVQGNGGNDSAFIFRSILSIWNPLYNYPSIPVKLENKQKNGKFEVLGVALYRLYNYAYYGCFQPDSNFHDFPVLEISDSALFKTYNGTQLFSYSLIMPAAKATKLRMEETMRRDLESYFGFKVKTEERKFPYWRLITTKLTEKKLRTKGGTSSYDFIPKAHFTAKNVPFSSPFSALKLNTGFNLRDETGITYQVDISMDLIYDGNVAELRKALNVYGLELIQGEEEKKVLVISDVEN